MAYEDEEYAPPPPSATPSPALQQFRGAFTDPSAQKWATEATIRLNDYFQKRRLAAANTQAGQNFVDDIGQFKDGLVGMVRSDPVAVHTALDLVHPTMAALIGTMPNAPADAADHHAALSGEMQREIAAAAVTSAAERSEPLARHLLGNERIQGVLGDDAHQTLTRYTDLQAGARQADNEAQQQAADTAREHVGHQSALNYLNVLTDPGTGDLQFPDGWNQGVMADPRLPPAGKAAVSSIYTNLRQNGDAQQSDPFLVSSLVGALAGNDPPKVPDVIQHAGTNLRLADAMHLGGLAAGGPHQRQGVAALDDAIKLGESQLAVPENGAAGEAAFGRYVNWLLPAVRNGAVLDPASKDYALSGGRMQSFAPQPGDYVAPVLPIGDRPTLHQIFSRGGRPQSETRNPGPGGEYNDEDTGIGITAANRFGITGKRDEISGERGDIKGTSDAIPLIQGRMNDLADFDEEDKGI